MKVLIIYELNPEEVLKTIAEMDEKEYQRFRIANGYVVNVSEFDEKKDAAVGTIGAALCNDPEIKKHHTDENELLYFGRWPAVENLEDILGVEKIIHCGILV